MCIFANVVNAEHMVFICVANQYLLCNAHHTHNMTNPLFHECTWVLQLNYWFAIQMNIIFVFSMATLVGIHTINVQNRCWTEYIVIPPKHYTVVIYTFTEQNHARTPENDLQGFCNDVITS